MCRVSRGIWFRAQRHRAGGEGPVGCCDALATCARYVLCAERRVAGVRGNVEPLGVKVVVEELVYAQAAGGRSAAWV